MRSVETLTSAPPDGLLKNDPRLERSPSDLPPPRTAPRPLLRVGSVGLYLVSLPSTEELDQIPAWDKTVCSNHRCYGWDREEYGEGTVREGV